MATPLDWSLLQGFLVLAESGSLSQAAPLLGLSQPSLSRQLARLESLTGQLLFERHPRGMSLTAAGRALLPAARRMREGAQDLALALAAREQQLAGTVRLTASEVVSAYFLPELLLRLRLAHPEIQIELVASNEVENLLERSADIALRMVRPTQGMLVARKLADWPLGVFAHRRYLQRRGMPTRETMAAHEWLGYDRSDQLLRGFAAAGFAVEPSFFALRCDQQTVLWEALRAGLGLGVGLVALAARDPELVQVLPELPIPPLPLWLTAHRELRDTPRLRLVFDTIAEAWSAP
ncbi:LysR family transcriptional regulator [Paucibacter sp. APW11]|uniref:LysR family transcriptional regulator n=1 Tax=Roseateles aquae TaxID=3077235 RepID=A0ABU3PI00_9BURK|nr:LysR family transcriptional regulator [Paucibacter sp. APW11]MDT9002196.1 LysR family transcriptional regulator [Paucibacter sp. APW11]